MMRGSDQLNVIPRRPHIDLDCRLLPGTSPIELTKMLKDIIDDDHVEIQARIEIQGLAEKGLPVTPKGPQWNFVKENMFEQLIQLSNYTKRTDFITSMGDMKQKIGEEEVAYFDKEFLIKRWLGLSMDEYRMNERYKKEEAALAEKKKKESGSEEGGEGGGGFTL